VDLTEDTDEEMPHAPATPPPQVSDGEVDMEEEDNLLSYGIGQDHADNNDSSDEDGFQHV